MALQSRRVPWPAAHPVDTTAPAVRYHVFRTGSLSKPLVFSRGCGAKVVSEHPSGVISNNRKDVPSQLFSSLS
jgi:hypothetical protein